MVKRKKIAINFFTDYKQATGLAIYLLNIIQALNLLNDEEKPEVVVICTPSAPINDIERINYPYLTIFQAEYVWNNNFIIKALNKLTRMLFRKNIFQTHVLRTPIPKDIHTVYPNFDIALTKPISEKIYWKADFQEKYYPQFFPESDLIWAEKFMKNIASKENVLVLSSQDAINDFKKFYPHYRNQIKLLRFASFLPKYDHLVLDGLREKYSIPNQDFFFVANQFWPHKNHLTILKAINHVKNELKSVFLFSGNTASYRDKEYFPMLKQFIEDNELHYYVKILGFIDRDEQIKLMSEAKAIIQPSLFEGWSTVIEDAKALNQIVIASSIRVNQEQLSLNSFFFEPMDFQELGRLIIKVQNENLKPRPFAYSKSIAQFKEDVKAILLS